MADRQVVWCFRLVTDSTSTGFSVAALDLGEVFQESGILYGLIALTGIFLFKNIILVIMYKMFVDFCMTQPPTFLLSYIYPIYYPCLAFAFVPGHLLKFTHEQGWLEILTDSSYY